jgi:acetyltransferase-like isoleucine patch superfamily enzyme
MSAAVERSRSFGSSIPSLSEIGTKLHSIWLRFAYRFAGFGRGVSIHPSCDIRRSVSPQIRLGDRVYLAPKVWLDAVPDSIESEPKIVIGNGCAIGRRSTISARTRITLEADVLLAPDVLITDHNSEYAVMGHLPDASEKSSGGQIFIGRNSWLGIGAVIACGSEDLNLGRHCVVGANAVVTQSFPAFSVIAGNPAKLIRMQAQRKMGETE